MIAQIIDQFLNDKEFIVLFAGLLWVTIKFSEMLLDNVLIDLQCKRGEKI